MDTEELLHQHEWLRRLASRLVRADESEDLVQDTLVKALERRPEPRRAWLATVLRRQTRDARSRRRNRLARERHAARTECLPSADVVSARLALQRRLVECLTELPRAQRDCIYLRFYEDRAPREIARHLNVPVETVRTRIKRGLAQLRRELDREYGRDDAWRALLAPWLVEPDSPAPFVKPLLGYLSMKTLVTVALLAFLALVFFTLVEPGGISSSANEHASSHPVEEPPDERLASPDDSSTSTRREERTPDVESPAQSPNEQDALPAGHATIRGRLVDAQGRPVPAATVELYGGRDYTGVEYEPLRLTNETDERGSFQFQLRPRAIFTYHVRTRTERHALRVHRFPRIEPGEQRDLGDLVLHGGATLVVHVLDVNGLACPQPWRVQLHAKGNEHVHVEPPGSPTDDLSSNGGYWANTLRSGDATEPRDTITIHGLPEGPCRIEASAGFLRTTEENVVLAAAETRHVSLRYGGPSPADQLHVTWRMAPFYDPPAAQHVKLVAPDGTSHSPIEKANVFRGLPPGTYELRVEDPRYESVRVAGLQPGPVMPIVPLVPNSRLELHVEDAAGRPIDRFSVMLSRDPQVVEVATAEMPRAGHFELPLVAGGYRVEVQVPTFERGVSSTLTMEPGATEIVTVCFERPAIVRGVVVAGSGRRAMAQTSVTLWAQARVDDGPESPRTWIAPGLQEPPDVDRHRVRKAGTYTDDSGHFEFADLPPGAYVLSAEVTRSNVALSEPFTVAAGDVREDVELRLPHAASLHVRITGSPTNTYRGEIGIDLAPYERMELTRGLNTSGTVLFPALPPGSARVGIRIGRRGGGFYPLGEVVLVAESELGVTFDLSDRWPGNALVTLDLTTPTSETLQVFLESVDDPQRRHGEVIRDGATARFESLWPGRYAISVQSLETAWSYDTGRTIDVPPQGEATQRASLPLRGATLLIVDRDSGSPLPHHALSLIRLDGPVHDARLETDEQGRVELTLPPGSHFHVIDRREFLRACGLDEGVVDYRRGLATLASRTPELTWDATSPSPIRVEVQASSR
ncbi:MAG: sigma-70 family RNA polymerase sigma factor [Planctomycetes bacterium]|nr:sigma-70 family RNA polymerase sigma factor [Planctomycetota bacterium]